MDTPDSVLQSGLCGFGAPRDTALRSMVDPLDYDRLRYLQMNGHPTTFEETIHRVRHHEIFVNDSCTVYVYTIRFCLI